MDTKQDWAHFTRRLISKEHDGRHGKRWRERNQHRAPKMHHLAPSTAKDMQLDCPSLSPQEGLNASMNAMPGKCTDALSCGEKRSLTRVTEECSECRTNNRSDWTPLSYRHFEDTTRDHLHHVAINMSTKYMLIRIFYTGSSVQVGK